MTITFFFLPSHSTKPSPSNPFLHVHVNEPGVFLQSAFLWQRDPSVHSSMSRNNRESRNVIFECILGRIQ